MKLTGKSIRDVERALHLIAGFLLLALVFTPLGEGAVGVALRVVLVPVLVASGMLMWQQARVTRLLRRLPAGRASVRAH